jgi:putative transposase
MTIRKNAAIAAKSAALPKIPKELLDQFVSGPKTGEAVNAASMAFKKALIERALGAELGHHLGYSNGAGKPEAVSNQRNGTSGKAVLNRRRPAAHRRAARPGCELRAAAHPQARAALHWF